MNSKRARVVLNSLVKGGQGDKAGLTGRALKVSSIDRAAPAPKERGPARSRSEFPLRARLKPSSTRARNQGSAKAPWPGDEFPETRVALLVCRPEGV
ncbi:MAG: hypothetical protein DMG23_06915 [Acidobacteria bacterium]|nr:MAG: hypothetical protein DMG23_06915 [Acidobacteriota bacterium]